MTEPDNTRERDHHVDLSWSPAEEGMVATPAQNGSGDQENTAGQPATLPTGRRPLRTFALVLLGVAALGAVVVALWFTRTVTSAARVPDLSGMTPSQASAALADAHLADGLAYFEATAEFPEPLVLKQWPLAGAEVSQDTSVDVRLAVEPSATLVPDVGLAQSDRAAAVLGSALFRPRLTYAYSTDVATDLVIEQLPRAGDEAVTGSDVTLVVSLGPGKGEPVPSVLGKKASAALSALDASALYAQLRIVIDPSVPQGTVVDQAPSGGAVVPVQSGVTLSVAVPSAAAASGY